MWYIHTLEHYSTIKSEITPFAATWMQVVLVVKSLPVNAGHATGHAMQDMQRTQVRSLGGEDALE